LRLGAALWTVIRLRAIERLQEVHHCVHAGVYPTEFHGPAGYFPLHGSVLLMKLLKLVQGLVHLSAVIRVHFVHPSFLERERAFRLFASSLGLSITRRQRLSRPKNGDLDSLGLTGIQEPSGELEKNVP